MGDTVADRSQQDLNKGENIHGGVMDAYWTCRYSFVYGTLGTQSSIPTLASDLAASKWRFHPDGFDKARLLSSPVRNDGSSRKRTRWGGCVIDQGQ